MSGKAGQRTTKQINIPLGYSRTVLDDLDNRYRPVREAKARFRQLAADLGGVRELSYQKQSLLWRFVFLEGWLEDQERRMVQGQAVDEGKWLSALGTFTSLLQRIGLERKARVVSPIERLRLQSAAGSTPDPSTGEIADLGVNVAADQPATETVIEVTGDRAS